MNTNFSISPCLSPSTFTKTIWLSQKDAFLKKLKHLNKILANHGKSPISVTFQNPHISPVRFTYHTKGESYLTDSEKTFNIEMIDAVCSGLTTIKKDDCPYTYIGTVSIQDGVRQVFCQNDSYKDFFMDKFREGFCDHCGTIRRNRKSYHLFLNESSNSVLQIGSTCAKEYFGIDSTKFLDCYAQTFLIDYEGCLDDFPEYHSGSVGFFYEQVAPALSYATRGFLKWVKKDAGSGFDLPLQDQPTAQAVNCILSSSLSENPINFGDQSTNTALVSYPQVVAYWQQKYSSENSTFAFNCLNAVKAGYATSRTMGSFCYAIFAAYNFKVRQLLDAERAAHTTIVPCPFPKGTRTNLSGIITNIRVTSDIRPNSENYYNNYEGDEITKYIVDFTAHNGTLYHFSTSAAAFANFKTNDHIEMRCTIEDTKPYKGIPYTRVSRPKAKLISQTSAA